MTDDVVDNPERLLFDVAAVRAIDRAAIAGGIDGYELMTRAARYALEVALAAFPGASRWRICCGGGNNGGDGYLLARLAREQGIDASVACLSPPDRLAGDAARAHRDAVAAGVPIADWSAGAAAADLWVDAMLGSGLTRDVGGAYADAVAEMNRSAVPVLALDLPTGLDGDDGRVLGTAVQADRTATFVAQKTGLYLGDGPACRGRLHFSALGVDARHYAGQSPRLRLARPGDLGGWLPRRPRQAHKGDFGHVLVVGGSPGMPGAARLCAEAALRAGAGRVSVATHPDHASSLPAGCPELMCRGVRGADDLAPMLAQATVVAVGPGLGLDDWARELLAAVRDAALPCVMDADALTLLAETPDRAADRVLTPHPGEAGRLLGLATADVQKDRPAALAGLADRYGGCSVLKGAGTLISSDRTPWLCAAGNPGMAAAGMGDVLTGFVAGLRAQGLTAEQAAVAGVVVHAHAGDVAATGGERGLLASDLLKELRPWLNP